MMALLDPMIVRWGPFRRETDLRYEPRGRARGRPEDSEEPMDPKTITWRATLFGSGLLTAPEWANALLDDLVSAPELDAAFVSFLDSLPHEVGQEFRHLMVRIEEADFRWTSFFRTSSTAPRDPTEFSDRLRRVSAWLRQRRVNGEAPRLAEPGIQESVGAAKTSSIVADAD